MRRMLNPIPEFMTISVMLCELMAHRCDCDSCRANKSAAFAAFAWLCGKTGVVPMQFEEREMAGEMRTEFRADTSDSAGVDEIMAEIRRDPSISPEMRALAEGWLARKSGRNDSGRA